MTEQMIPESEIDKMIQKLENPDDPYDTRIGDNDKIIVLKEIKKKAIPAVTIVYCIEKVDHKNV